MIFILWSFLSKIIPEKGNPSPGNRYFRKKIISQGGYHHREYSGAVFTKTYKYSRSEGQTIFPQSIPGGNSLMKPNTKKTQFDFPSINHSSHTAYTLSKIFFEFKLF
jgi:hypothetical protein